MKRNFLILMLLSLLPLAGWAIDISNFTVTLGTVSYEYSAGTPTLSNFVVKNPANDATLDAANYDLVYYKDGVEVAASAVKNVGTYAVAARAKTGNVDYTGETSTKIEFNITQATLTVSYDVTSTDDKELAAIFYGEATPVLDKAKLFYDGFKGSENKSVVNTDGFTAVIDKTTASADKDGSNLTGVDASKYTLGGLTAMNYKFTYKNVTLRIKQIDLSAVATTEPADHKNWLSISTNKKGAKAFTYNAAAQYPDYTITYYDRQGNAHNLSIAAGTDANDYSVAYKKKALTDGATYSDNYDQTVKDAAWYKGQITGAGNYSGSLALTEADFEYQIAKKGITVYVTPMEGKVYDGNSIPVTGVDTDNDTSNGYEDIDVTGAQIICPVLAADNTLKGNVKVHFADNTLNTTTAAPKAAGEYGLVPYLVGEGLGNNYDVEDGLIEVGSYTITQRPVKVTALDQIFTYNGKKQTLNTTKTANTTFKAEGTGVDASGLVGTETVDNLFTIALKSGVEIKESTNSAYTGAILINVDEEAQAESNYVITPVAGNVIVNGKKLFVIEPTYSKEYGYEVTAEDVKPLLNVSGVELGGTPSYTIKNTTDAKTYQIGDRLPVGTYTLSIVQSSVTAPANYSIDRFEDGEITITTKALKAVVASQTVSKDDVVTGDGNKLQQGSQYVTFTGLVGDEKVKYTISSDQSTGTENTDGIANAITVALTAPGAGETGFSNSNYTLADGDITKGKLYIVGANTVVLNRDEADLVNFIKTNKGTAENQNVKFSARSLTSECWNSFVLPFDVTVAKLSEAVGYCIVNVLDPTNTKVVDNKAQIRFKIEMKQIKANTPFLMKTAYDKNMSDVTIPNVKIVEAATTAVKNEDEDISFIPLYVSRITNRNERYPVNASDSEPWKKGNGTGSGLKALASLVLIPEGAEARIFVEDFENGTTVIKQLGIDSTDKAYAVEGWYTLNGVKLQGAPTTKGIYINNGKKVIIK